MHTVKTVIAMKTLKTSGTMIVVAQLLLVKKEIIGKKIIRTERRKNGKITTKIQMETTQIPM